MSTAPMPKLGAIRQLVPGDAASQPRTVSSRSASKPVVPTTGWMPCSISHRRLPITTSGWVKSTTTSAPSSASIGSSLSTPATSSMSGAASTALHTSTPTRPRAPSTPTLITGSTLYPGVSADGVGEVLVAVRADDGQRERPVEHVGGDRLDLLGSDRVDAGQHLVYGHQLVVHQLVLADAGHARAGVLQPEDETAAHLALAARDLLLRQALGHDPGHLVPADLEHVVDLAGQAADVDAELAGVGVGGGVAVGRVGQAALLPDLLEQPRRHAAAERGVQHAEREAALVGARQRGGAEHQIGLLGGPVEDVHAGEGLRAGAAGARRVGHGGAGEGTGPLVGPRHQLHDLLVADVARHGDDGARRLVVAVVV